MTKHDYPVNNRLDDREKAAVWQAISTPSADGRARRAPRRFGPAFAGLGMAAAVIAVVLLADWPQRTTQDLASRDHAPVQETVIVSVPPPDTAPEVPVRAEGEAVRRERTTPPPPRLIESVPAPQDIAARSNEKVEQYASDEASARPTPAEIPQDQLHLGGGRRGDVQAQFDGVLAEPAPAIGKVSREADAMHVAPPPASAESGGTANPNDRPYDLVYHEHYGVNPFVAAEDDALSTFAVDVDDASWAVARRYLRDGNLPPREAVRLEEFVNAFDPGWPAVAGGDDFAIRVDGAPSRFGDGYHLLRVGIQGREITAAQRRPADLVFVIDISGSMARENRLGLVKQALRILVDELREGDRVGIVVYGSEARVVLEPVGIERRTAILAAIDGLQTDGATNAEAGLRLAYGLARRGQDSQAINRLILCSDGVANVGDTGADSILASVRQEADRGIMLTTIGFGMGNYNDVLMEKLADQGDGTYHYVDRIEEAERVFRQNLTGTLQTLGRDAKVQVEFDPSAVDRWRLLGYENRDVADRDFRNDAVDAGEIGSGHTVVALYEVKLTDRGRDRDARLATVRFRWEHPRHDPRAGKVEEIEQRIDAGDLARKWQDAPPRLRLAGTVAEFAEILRGSFWAQDSALADLVPEADRLARDLEGDAQVVEFRDLVRKAATVDR
jgi:Ca-activated chloride channel family protein